MAEFSYAVFRINPVPGTPDYLGFVVAGDQRTAEDFAALLWGDGRDDLEVVLDGEEEEDC